MEIYAYQNKKSVLEKSSSGGAFLALVEALWELEKRDKRVYGAAFDSDFHVRHMAAETKAECVRFCGSKYVNSDITWAVQEIPKDLEAGRAVLFTGTPCQVYQIRRAVDKAGVGADSLFCVDLICHGTPDAAFWESYKNWIEEQYHSRLSAYRFRARSRWYPYSVEAVFESGKVVKDSQKIRAYQNLYGKGLIMRECCYHCGFAKTERQGDITLGDFWGIEKVLPELGEKENISQVLIHTKKGEELFEIVRRRASGEHPGLCQRCMSGDFLNYQHNLNAPTGKPKETEKLKKDFRTYGLEAVLKKYGGFTWIGKTKFWIHKVLKITGIEKK